MNRRKGLFLHNQHSKALAVLRTIENLFQEVNVSVSYDGERIRDNSMTRFASLFPDTCLDRVEYSRTVCYHHSGDFKLERDLLVLSRANVKPTAACIVPNLYEL